MLEFRRSTKEEGTEGARKGREKRTTRFTISFGLASFLSCTHPWDHFFYED